MTLESFLISRAPSWDVAGGAVHKKKITGNDSQVQGWWYCLVYLGGITLIGDIFVNLIFFAEL